MPGIQAQETKFFGGQIEGGLEVGRGIVDLEPMSMVLEMKGQTIAFPQCEEGATLDGSVRYLAVYDDRKDLVQPRCNICVQVMALPCLFSGHPCPSSPTYS